MVAFVVFVPSLFTAEPPPGLPKKVAIRETENEAARADYTYRQSVVIEEFDDRGMITGRYREIRDIIFSPQGRTEQMVESPTNSLKRLLLTPEDFRDIREVQPLLLTSDQLWIYETRFRGEEQANGIDCWLLEARPRQILSGQRLFEGMLWIDKRDYSIIQTQGKAVPEILSLKSENRFPRFTTLRQQVDGKYWFPQQTVADDTLHFRSGPQRIRMIIRYSDYKKFSAESTVTFEDAPANPPQPQR